MRKYSMKKKNQARIKVFLVDDHPVIREGVRAYGFSNKSVAGRLGISVRTA